MDETTQSYAASLAHEQAFWGSCVSTWAEEAKQQEYAKRMGLAVYGTWPRFDLDGRSIVDLGGGPVSMLLKTVSGSRLTVVDPATYPSWVRQRYTAHHVKYVKRAAETFTTDEVFDECWIYNVLQHVTDPGRVLDVARRCARLVRVFEWTGIPADDLHPHTLQASLLDGWAGIVGTVEYGINRFWGESVPAWAWYAVFPGVATASAHTMNA